MLSDFFANDIRYGGTQFISYGSTGSGKTLLMHEFMRYEFDKGTLIIAKMSDIDTILNIGRPLNIITNGDYEFTVKSIKDLSTFKINLSEYNIKHSVVDSPENIIENLDHNRINLLMLEGLQQNSSIRNRAYPNTIYYTLFLYFLIHSNINKWTSIYLDELQEVYMLNPFSGNQYWTQHYFTHRILNHLRKSNINLRMATHTPFSTDYSLQNLIPNKIYLYGSDEYAGYKHIPKGYILVKNSMQYKYYRIPNLSQYVPKYVIISNPIDAKFEPELNERYCEILNIERYIECSECSNTYESRLKKCPKCGNKNNEVIMR